MSNKTPVRYIKYDIEVTMRNMKELRIKAKLSQQELADLLGINRTSVSRYENGTLKPCYDTLVRLYRILHGITIDQDAA